MLLKSNECDMSPWNAMPCCQCCGEFPRAISLVGAESIQGIQPKGMHSPICQCKREALNNSIDLLLGRLESLSFNSYRTPSMFAFIMKKPLQYNRPMELCLANESAQDQCCSAAVPACTTSPQDILCNRYTCHLQAGLLVWMSVNCKH